MQLVRLDTFRRSGMPNSIARMESSYPDPLFHWPSPLIRGSDLGWACGSEQELQSLDMRATFELK